MSHDIESMAFAYKEGEKIEYGDNPYAKPWHFNMTSDRSVPVSNDMSVRDMIVAAGLDWTVERTPLQYTVDGKTYYGGADQLYRSSDARALTQAAGSWNEVQPDAFVDFFHDFCEEGSMEMNTMGSLHGGRQLFALAKINEKFDLFRGKDVIESFFLFSNPIEYGKSMDLRFTPTRVVCQNTLSIALRGFDAELGVRVSHRQPFNPDDVKQALGIAKEQLGSYKEAAEFLAGKRFSIERLKQYYSDVFPGTYKRKKEVEGIKLNKRAQTALAALETQPGAELGEGTWWQAYNSVTFAVDHLLGKTQAGRIDSAMFGAGQKTKNRALDKALTYAEAA